MTSQKKNSIVSPVTLKRRVDAAMGRIPCDLQITDVQYLDVFSCEWRTGTISIVDGVIVALESGLKAVLQISGKGKWLVPGFIDAHVHVESSLLTPKNFEDAVLACGTTTAVCDPHEFANVLGVEGIQFFLDEAQNLNLDLRVMLSSCVPATTLETNGGGTIEAEELAPLRVHVKTLGLAEMMNVPGVVGGDPGILQKLSAFSDTSIDGHCPLVTGQTLSAYASCGISSCHESSELEEAREKLSKGIAIWIREGSVAKDLQNLIPILNEATSPQIGFCTDDRNPLDIATEGHIDFLVRSAIARGVKNTVVYRSASWSVARHYNLRGLGAVAPGYAADLVLLNDADACSISLVFKAGVPTAELSAHKHVRVNPKNTMFAKMPTDRELEGPSGQVHVIEVAKGRILTERSVSAHNAQGVAKLSVLERHGHGFAPANAYVRGFGEQFKGAIASSVGHDSHNLIVTGDTTENMRVALAALIDMQGGFCVVQNGRVIAQLALPLGGLMSGEDAKSIEKSLRELHKASHAVGCKLPEPFLQLAFLSLPVIPKLKLTNKGLVDVELFQIIPVRAS